MRTYSADLCIVGGGAIGLVLAAFQAARFPDKKLVVIGGHPANLSASKAAGAMVNVASEIDYINHLSNITQVKLSHYSELFDAWAELESLLSTYLPGGKLLYGTGTEIRLTNNSKNVVEVESFQKMHDTARRFNIPVTDIVNADLYSYFNLPKEQSVDSLLLLNSLRSFLYAKNTQIIDQDVLATVESSDYVTFSTLDFTINASQSVIASGVFSDQIIREINIDTSALLPCYSGVGSALLLSSELDYIQEPVIQNIVRTPNRGGTCGVHAVQRHDCLYVGASSMTTADFPKKPRAESIETLLKGFSSTLQQPLTGLSMSTVTGYRPTSLDTYPIVGRISKHVYAIYGTKRDGLTWSPLIADSFVSVSHDEYNSYNFLNQLSKQYSPFRRPLSFGSHQHACSAYVESKVAEALQHGHNLDHNQRQLLLETVSSLHSNLPDDFSVHPELVNIFAHNENHLNHLKSLV